MSEQEPSDSWGEQARPGQSGYTGAGYGGPPSGYGAPPGYGGGQPVAGTNVLAILSLVFAFVFWPAGLVLGFVARSQIRRTGEQGAGLALAGIIIGFVALACTVLVIGLFVVGATMVGGDSGGTAPAFPAFAPATPATPAALGG